jgi:hypothetical protein
MWWARPRKLCGLQRPGGGGRAHRAERRDEEIEWLLEHGVRLVVSVSPTRHNLAAYDDAGLPWLHVPVTSAEDGEEEFDELRALLRRELRGRGAVAVHGDYRTDFVAALCAAHLHELNGLDPAQALLRAAAAGLEVTEAACALLGVRLEEVVAVA